MVKCIAVIHEIFFTIISLWSDWQIDKLLDRLEDSGRSDIISRFSIDMGKTVELELCVASFFSLGHYIINLKFV